MLGTGDQPTDTQKARHLPFGVSFDFYCVVIMMGIVRERPFVRIGFLGARCFECFACVGMGDSFSDVLGLVSLTAGDSSVYSYGFTFEFSRRVCRHCEFVLERMVVLLLLTA